MQLIFWIVEYQRLCGTNLNNQAIRWTDIETVPSALSPCFQDSLDQCPMLIKIMALIQCRSIPLNADQCQPMPDQAELALRLIDRN